MNKIIIFSCLFFLFFVSCQKGNKEVTPAGNIASQVEAVLLKLNNLLKDYTCEIHTFTLKNTFILSIWLMFYGTNDETNLSSLIYNIEKVLDFTGAIINEVLYEIQDIKNVFDVINPMIVDKSYYLWYRNIIPVNLLQNNNILNQKEVLIALYSELSYIRNRPVEKNILLNSNLKNWFYVRNIIDPFIIQNKSTRDGAAYPIILDDYSTIQLHIQDGSKRNRAVTSPAGDGGRN